MNGFKVNFLKYLIPPVILATVLVSVISALLSYSDLRSELYQKQKTMAASFSSTLVGPMWNFEKQEIERILQALLIEKDVTRATVYDRSGNVIKSVGTGSGDEIGKVDVPIQHIGKKDSYLLGNLKIEFSEERILQLIYTQVKRDSLLLFVVVFVAIGAASIVNRLIVKDLERAVRERTNHLAEEIERRKQIESELQTSHQIIEASPDLISFVDIDFTYQHVNPAYGVLFGKSRKEIIGLHIEELVGEDAFQNVIKPHLAKCFDGEEVSYESWFSLEGHDSRYMSLRYLPIFDDTQTVIGAAILGHDITLQKQVADEHKKAKDIAENANRTKSQFLAAASHDLRQPLQAISMLVGALSDSLGDTEPEGISRNERILTSIQRSVGSLRDLLGSLLDLSKLDAGVIKAEMQDVAMKDVLKDIGDQLGLSAREKDLELRIVPSSVTVNSDPVLLRQIIENLGTNAVKYTHSGKILIGCRHLAGQLRIEVWDTGIGIREENLDLIFEEFQQLDNPSRQKEKGLGLGLAIVKRTADMIGATLSVRSEYTAGSVFRLDIPLSTPKATISETGNSSSEQMPDHGSGSILVVEDDQTILEGTILLLEGWGYTCQGALSADEALEIIKQKTCTPDCVILDYQLPDNANGVELYHRILDTGKSIIPGIIISGATTPFALERFEHSALSHLTKPIDPDGLRTTLTSLLKN